MVHIDNCNDVANVVMSKLDTTGRRASDASTLIRKGGLDNKVAWQAKVAEAAEDEHDEFWQQVQYNYEKK